MRVGVQVPHGNGDLPFRLEPNLHFAVLAISCSSLDSAVRPTQSESDECVSYHNNHMFRFDRIIIISMQG